MRRTSEPAADSREWGERVFQVAVFGRDFTFAFHEVVVGFTLLLRLLMGWIFLWAGFDKAVNGFTAEGFLLHATSGPLDSWFVDLGGSATALSLIDPLVTYGQIAMGLALVLGVATRLTLVFAAIMMFLFYLAQFPPEHDLFVDYYLVYIAVYLMLGALGAGRILGVDRYVERLPGVRERAWARYLLG